ncbi:hypothetical protein [Dysgonomonas sp. 25]|uniref:hypothetical protein n=1 Tax=Dysgonomonas sp. 25 TaxID=2302933 RepID=UPI0013D3A9A9|nr:hypothetical protein [Dysgonomonas sp. 25]NDV69597.1 hypothetical protein [Dysgonomonas sp. 25]
MPINIYIDNFERIDYLCEDIWDLPNQIDSLEKWLQTKGVILPKGSYVADIGFDIRKDATGGGAVLSSESMKIMGDIGMDVYFSEYPESSE